MCWIADGTTYFSSAGEDVQNSNHSGGMVGICPKILLLYLTFSMVLAYFNLTLRLNCDLKMNNGENFISFKSIWSVLYSSTIPIRRDSSQRFRSQKLQINKWLSWPRFLC